jgi:hypothetical protein
MANKRKTLGIKAPEAGATSQPPSPNSKDRVKEMFGGVEQPPQMKVDVVLDLPEHADPEGKTAKDAKDSLDGFINAFGTEKLPQTQFPVSRSHNNGQAAAEFAMWDHVARRCNKRLEQAAEQAAKEGVFGDPSDYVEGETQMTYNSAEFSISVKKNAGSKVIDKALVEAVLREVAPHKWQELFDRCHKPRAGAAMRIVSLK